MYEHLTLLNLIQIKIFSLHLTVYRAKFVYKSPVKWRRITEVILGQLEQRFIVSPEKFMHSFCCPGLVAETPEDGWKSVSCRIPPGRVTVLKHSKYFYPPGIIILLTDWESRLHDNYNYSSCFILIDG